MLLIKIIQSLITSKDVDTSFFKILSCKTHSCYIREEISSRLIAGFKLLHHTKGTFLLFKSGKNNWLLFGSCHPPRQPDEWFLHQVKKVPYTYIYYIYIYIYMYIYIYIYIYIICR